jgi:TonB-dependent Receptor Plug Domain/Carboxypeptidase regulatory-like domain
MQNFALALCVSSFTRPEAPFRRLLMPLLVSVFRVAAVVAVLWCGVASAQNAALKGKVSDPAGEPVPSARVYIPNVAGDLTETDGVFAINGIPAGSYRLIVIGDETFDTLFVDVTLAPGQVQNLDLKLKATTTLTDIEISSDSRVQIDTRDPAPGLTSITSEQIKFVPNIGSADLGSYLQVVPGVVFTGDQGGQLFIRGGTPVQNLVLLDGAIMYNPFHTLGLFSVFDADYIRRADVYSGGFAAKYGGRISSVMDITTRNGNFNRFSGKVEVNPIMSSALVEGPIGRPNERTGQSTLSYLVSARHCYLDATSPEFYSYVNDSVSLPFNFTDLYGKITLGNGLNQATFFGFHQTDKVSYGYPTDYKWTSSGGGLNFMVLPSNTKMILSGNFSVSRFTNGQINPDEVFPRESSIGGFTGRLNFQYYVAGADEISYGLQFQGFRNELRYTSGLGLLVDNENNNTEFAGYVQYKKVFRKKIVLPNGFVDYFNRAVIEPSVRVHYYNNLGVSPEFRLRAKLNFKNVSLQLAGGTYTQNLVAALSDRDVVQLFQGYIASPQQGMSNRPLNPRYWQAAQHALAGVEVTVLRGVKFQLEGWYKRFLQVTNINRNRLFPEEDQFVAESGEAYGADATVTYVRGKLYLYGTYGLANNFRTDPNTGDTYAPVWDRRHNANIVANYRIGELRAKRTNAVRDSKWEFGARFNLGTGFPFTQTQGFYQQQNFEFEGAGTNYVAQNPELGILLSDDYNGGRLPDYHRLDVMFKRRWILGEWALLEANIQVVNAYNRENIFYYDRVRNARVNQLPTVPSAGLQFRW